MSDNFDNLLKSDQGFPEPGGGGSMSSRTDLSQAAQTGSSLQTESMDFVLKYIRRLDELRPGIWSRISLDDCRAIISTFVELTGNAFPQHMNESFLCKKSRKYLGTSTTNQYSDTKVDFLFLFRRFYSRNLQIYVLWFCWDQFVKNNVTKRWIFAFEDS